MLSFGSFLLLFTETGKLVGFFISIVFVALVPLLLHEKKLRDKSDEREKGGICILYPKATCYVWTVDRAVRWGKGREGKVYNNLPFSTGSPSVRPIIWSERHHSILTPERRRVGVIDCMTLVWDCHNFTAEGRRIQYWLEREREARVEKFYWISLKNN